MQSGTGHCKETGLDPEDVGGGRHGKVANSVKV
jgi:hypothetical protein